jgi:hypothetical protein
MAIDKKLSATCVRAIFNSGMTTVESVGGAEPEVLCRIIQQSMTFSDDDADGLSLQRKDAERYARV